MHTISYYLDSSNALVACDNYELHTLCSITEKVTHVYPSEQRAYTPVLSAWTYETDQSSFELVLRAHLKNESRNLYSLCLDDPNASTMLLATTPAEIVEVLRDQIADWDEDFYGEDDGKKWKAEIETMIASFLADPSKSYSVDREYDRVALGTVLATSKSPKIDLEDPLVVALTAGMSFMGDGKTKSIYVARNYPDSQILLAKVDQNNAMTIVNEAIAVERFGSIERFEKSAAAFTSPLTAQSVLIVCHR